ncbi:MAG TPA: VOC family protein [Gemmatimonadales bacterium]|nr:VOC family protein [Gemmatimonadales bacterium]
MTAPHVDCDRLHGILVVPDVRRAVEYYTKQLGFQTGFLYGDPPTYAGMNLDQVQIFLEQGTAAPNRTSMYFVVGDADELHAFHRAQGVDIVEPPGDRPYGLRDYGIRDLNGYGLSFGHYIFNTGEPLAIERVDVPLRLEKRLAAALQELATHKRMSLTSCLEETLLHTFEPLGDGVASPHTKSQLRYIQQLKVKHGIDYDSHASYRFVEKP